jgi:homospermidine synthase
MQVNFGGRVLVLGAGSVSQCLQPLLLRHLRMDFSKLTIMDFEDKRAEVRETLDAGAKYVQKKVTRTNLGTLLGKYVSKGDLIIDLAWNIDCGDITQWCHDNGVMYINTSVELWDPYGDAAATPPNERTLYFRHRKLRNRVASWRAGGPTIVVEHGANPGLVSHWTKVALTDIAQTILARRLPKARRVTLEQALAKKSWNVVAQQIGLKTIHISERDTQIADEPKQVDEFVNTWSVEGFYEEGIAARSAWPSAGSTPRSAPGSRWAVRSWAWWCATAKHSPSPSTSP